MQRRDLLTEDNYPPWRGRNDRPRQARVPLSIPSCHRSSLVARVHGSRADRAIGRLTVTSVEARIYYRAP